MKCYILKSLILILALNVNCLFAQNEKFSFFEVENLSNISSQNLFSPQLNFYSDSFKPDAKVGQFYFSLINENWAQAYGGIMIKPLDWLSIGLGAGLEVNNNPYRFNLRMHIKKNKFSLMQIYEYGGSGFWYNIFANFQVTQNSKWGIVFKRFYGLGINYEYDFKSFPLALILSPLYDLENENYNFMLSLRYYL